MKIYDSEKLTWTITAVGGNKSDIVVLPKQLAKECNMTANGFDEVFCACLTGSKTNLEAYEKAEQIHVQYFEKRKYSDYGSYLASKSRRFKK